MLWPITRPEKLSLSERVRHSTNADFWSDYHVLPVDVRARADKQFALLKANPHHPSLQFKKIGARHVEEIWSVRVTLRYRALAVRLHDGYLWFWIGEHNVYDAKLS